MRLNLLKRNKNKLDPRTEAELARKMGKQVTREKALFLLIFSALACLVPILLGLRLWDSIPEFIETGLVRANDEPDPMPRWALVFVVPGLFFLLDVINHWQLRRFQRLNRMPPRHTLLLGRWGFPLVVLLACAWFIPSAAGRTDLSNYLIPLWALGWAVMMLGGTLWDCPQDSRLRMVFPISMTCGSGNRVASIALMIVGLALLLGSTLLLSV